MLEKLRARKVRIIAFRHCLFHLELPSFVQKQCSSLNNRRKIRFLFRNLKFTVEII
jgi:hypothetical protein